MITILAPDGIGEVTAGADLPAIIVAAVAANPLGPLQDFDIVVVTSKVVSKAEGRTFPADQRDRLIDAEATATVAHRSAGLRIVRTAHGLVQAAAGVDASNVDPEHVLALPLDADVSAEALRAGLLVHTGLRALGVIVSDTAGRAWRIGQTDHAIGAAGVRVLDDYTGCTDPYGQELRVTMTALADEIAAAADLAKGKLSGRPVAVIRGLPGLVPEAGARAGAGTDAGAGGAAMDRAETAADLVRPLAEDVFALGTEEAVLAAVLRATGQQARFEELVRLPRAEALEAIAGGRHPIEASLIRRLLTPAESDDGAGTGG